MMSEHTEGDVDYRIDAREVTDEPFETAMEALEKLERGESLLIVNDFDPKPLYDIIEDYGYEFESSKIDHGEWYLLVEHPE